MPLLSRVSVLAAKIETTAGTAETLAGADGAFNVFDAKITPEVTMEEREGQGGFDMLSQVAGGRRGKATFRTNLQWDGTATEPAWAETFFPACGWVKSGQVYYPKSEAPGSSVKTLTIAHYVNGTRHLLSGCVGTFKVTLRAGMPAYIEWDFTGVWGGKTDATILAPTYPTDLNLRWSGGVGQWNNVDLFASQAVIDAGNVITMREDPSSSSGYLCGIITNRYPKVTVDPEKTTVASQDRWGYWLSSAEYALELHCNGPTNSMLQFDAPKAQVIKIDYADREKLAIDNIEFACNKNSSTQDQSLYVTFTAAS